MNGFDSFRVRERAVAARWILAVAFAVLVGAFFRTQVMQHAKYQLQAETNRLRSVPLAPPRGPILDRNGRVIAENVPGYAVKLFAPKVDSLRAVLQRFEAVVPLDSGDVESIVRKYRQSPFQPVTVIGDASFDVVSRLEEHRAILPGLVIQSEPKRLYPNGRAVAHLVGYVGEVTENDLAANRFPGAALGTVVGKNGLERQYDSLLRGREGVRYIEVNARGRLVREDAAPPLLPTAGEPLRTTIDLDLQQYIDSIWPKQYQGAMIAMTPKGEVLALYSHPTYDPNDFIGGIPTSIWRELNTDSTKPLLNRAIFARYPPASPFKLATAAMALKRGLIDLDTHMPISCTGGMRLGNRVFRCWKKEGHGNLDLVGAVATSCDVYFYQLGLKLGLKAIVEDGVFMGFRDKSGIDLPNELRPIYPGSLAYFDSLYGPRRWSPPATTLNFSIGQGENTQTLVNMMAFYQALAGDGVEVEPYIGHPSTAQPRSLGLTPDQLAGLRQSLIAVVERGTARGASHGALKGDVLAIAGKTGTAQNSHGKDHGWFFGFAPADNPQIIVGSIMEFSEHGTTVVPYVVQALRRYVLGPGLPATDSAPKVKLLVPSEDTARPQAAAPAAPSPAPSPAVVSARVGR